MSNPKLVYFFTCAETHTLCAESHGAHTIYKGRIIVNREPFPMVEVAVIVPP